MKRAYTLLALVLMFVGCKSLPQNISTGSNASPALDSPEILVEHFYRLIADGKASEAHDLLTISKKSRQSIEGLEREGKLLQSQRGIKEILLTRGATGKGDDGTDWAIVKVKIVCNSAFEKNTSATAQKENGQWRIGG